MQCRNADFKEFYPLLKSDKVSIFEGDDLEQLEPMFNHSVLPIIKQCKECNNELPIHIDFGGTIIRPFRNS